MPKLTKKLIENSLPQQKDYIVWDDEIKGFGCRILPSGYKTYVFHYTSPATKKSSYLKIGVHGNYTTDLARDKAKRWCADIAHDIDPKEKKKAKAVEQQKSILFKDFWQIFNDRYIIERHKLNTIYGNSSRINKEILPFFGTKKISDITRDDVLAFKDTLLHKKSSGTICLTLLSTAFKQAELWGYRTQHSNPCHGVAKFPIKKKERFLSDSEFERLKYVLTDFKDSGRVSGYAIFAFCLLIYTGCRLREVTKLTWEEVDLEHHCLRLKDSKTGARVIPLNDQALGILASIKKLPDNPYVFCGEKPGIHLINVHYAWRLIRKAANLSDLRIHDLRHSFASFAINDGGLDLVHVQKLLGHKNISTTTRYAHLTDAKLSEATNKIFKTGVDLDN